jgi:hypothetical protein
MFLFCLKRGNSAAAMAQTRCLFENPEVVFAKILCSDFRLWLWGFHAVDGWLNFKRF